MARQEEPGFDPEGIFNEGVKYQAEQDDTLLREQIADELEAQGIHPDDIEQALFSDGSDLYAPRRGRRSKRRTSRKRARRAYDPAPRGGYREAARRYGRRAKGTLIKVKKYAAVGGAGLSFIGIYTKRAADLKAQGAMLNGKVVDGIIDAIQYDLKNFDTTNSMNKLKSNVGEIATPAVLGWAVKETKILGKYSGLAGDLLIGAAGGIALATALDDKPQARTMAIQQTVSQAQATNTQMAATMPQGSNPFAL